MGHRTSELPLFEIVTWSVLGVRTTPCHRQALLVRQVEPMISIAGGLIGRKICRRQTKALSA